MAQECGGCNVCCDVLEIKDVNSKANEMCQHCDIGVGCKIYEARPEPCKDFKCLWLQMERVHMDLRPDNCGVMFEKIADDIILGCTSGKFNQDLVLRQIGAFNSEGISVVVFNHAVKRKSLHLAVGHTQEYVDGVIDGRT
jgi:hypothetical protein